MNELCKINPHVTKNITIVFISDGQDNVPGTLKERLDDIYNGINIGKKINFLSIAIGRYFPTFVAMQLRVILYFINLIVEYIAFRNLYFLF